MRAGGPWRIKRIKRMEVPVSSLIRLLILDFEVRIVHMLLMSWGGMTAEEDRTAVRSNLQEEIQRTVAEVSQADVRTANVLWNRERNCPMLIDFERAVFLNCDSRSKRVGSGRGIKVEISSSSNKRCIWEKDESRGLASREIIRPQ